jgi:hypothetical protein
VGVSAYFYDWLAFRNVGFYRPAVLGSAMPKMYGLDTSERFSYSFARDTGLVLFAAPGWRITGGIGSSPYGEAGVAVKVGGFALGGGMRQLVRSWVHTGAPNETEFFVDISIGGAK